MSVVFTLYLLGDPDTTTEANVTLQSLLGPGYRTTFCVVFSHCFQIVPHTDDNVLKIILHARLQETSETLSYIYPDSG